MAPSIDDPVALLAACHDKIRRFTNLAIRLRAHLDLHEPDEQAQEAAKSVLRYFDVAAPLHHEDEERDLFPALRKLNNAQLNQCMAELDAEHAELVALWSGLKDWLEDTARGTRHVAPASLDLFVRQYAAHAKREEQAVFPFASQLEPSQIQRICDAMVARRIA